MASANIIGKPVIRQTKLYINGQFVDGVAKKTIPVYNPSTCEIICEVAIGEEEDINLAVKAAREAYNNSWKKCAGSAKAELINKLADLIEQNIDELAGLESIDNGKPFLIAKNLDINACVRTLRYFAGFADKIAGVNIPMSNSFLTYTRHEAFGVVGLITPWNFPLLMAIWKLAPALACGNTVVLKHSEDTPLSCLRLGELINEAGFPPGVVNIISGLGPVAGQALALHADVDKIGFTGSGIVGRKIMEYSAASNLKTVSLELGGKSPNIIFADADLDTVIEHAHEGLFFNSGQCCSAGSRIFVHESIYDEFINRMKIRSEKAVVGDPFNATTTQGPITLKKQLDKVLHYIEEGKKEAKLITGGAKHGDQGWFVQPTIFADVTNQMKIARDEIFGPVMCVLKFKDTDEAIRLANQTAYGLAAAVWTRDISTLFRVSHELNSGIVWGNCYGIADPSLPWGGFQESGIGKDLSQYALQTYTRVKCVVVSI
eukprot:TRINITY_DN908_c0_g1_i1.p1 TRINITY_DN908_c0_g1~~TRINITY_DN908_c0_g1_i1.p1  ORF type:complete len:499 (-),score=277.00 TRINITY_DN908_c0_g1_i1:109-1572(-)